MKSTVIRSLTSLMKTQKLKTSVLLLTLIGVAGSAPAQQVIDQQSTASIGALGNTSTSPSLGQSFTAGLGLIDFATFSLATSVLANYRVDLYNGSGYGGAILGSTAAVSPHVGSAGTALPIEFDFASPIVLTPGNSYTLRVVLASGPGGSFSLNGAFSNLNPYAGGGALTGTGVIGPSAANDFVFSEGFTVPEPSSMALLLGSVGMLAGWRRFGRTGKA